MEWRIKKRMIEYLIIGIGTLMVFLFDILMLGMYMRHTTNFTREDEIFARNGIAVYIIGLILIVVGLGIVVSG